MTILATGAILYAILETLQTVRYIPKPGGDYIDSLQTLRAGVLTPPQDVKIPSDQFISVGLGSDVSGKWLKQRMVSPQL